MTKITIDPSYPYKSKQKSGDGSAMVGVWDGLTGRGVGGRLRCWAPFRVLSCTGLLRKVGAATRHRNAHAKHHARNSMLAVLLHLSGDTSAVCRQNAGVSGKAIKDVATTRVCNRPVSTAWGHLRHGACPHARSTSRGVLPSCGTRRQPSWSLNQWVALCSTRRHHCSTTSTKA